MKKYLSNEDLTLRAVEPSDAQAMWEVETDSSQWVANSMSAPLSRLNLFEYAQNYDANPFSAGQLRLIVELKNQNRPIGIVDLYEISAQNRTSMLGIYILPQYRRQGYATRSIRILEDYCRNILNLRILGAKISEQNRASINLFKSLKFVNTGFLPGWLLNGKQTQNILLFFKNLNQADI